MSMIKASDLAAPSELRALSVLIGPACAVGIPDLKTRNTIGERVEHRRHRDEAIAHSGMSLEEPHLFFSRADVAAAQSLTSGRGFLGWVNSMMTLSHVGFAQKMASPE